MREVERAKGVIPSHPPGTNTFVKEFGETRRHRTRNRARRNETQPRFFHAEKVESDCNLVPVKLGTSIMNLPSYTISQGKDRAPARSYFKAIGFTDEDLKKPVIGIANTWIGTMPCNFLLRDLAVKVAAGIRQAGGTPMEYNTIAISDGITMGTEGMKTSLVSRDLIADSIELVARGHMFDGVIALVGCDKTIPGAAMAL